MSIQGDLIAYGQYTSDGNPRTLEIPSGVSYIEVEDTTLWGTSPTAVVRSWWQEGDANNAARQMSEGGASALSAVAITTNGFLPVDYASAAIGGAVAVTAVTAATPAVVSSASTAQVGDIVRIYGTTGMLQIAGMDFTVTAVNPGVTQTLGYLPAAGFAAAATAGFIRILSPYDLSYYPRKRYITAITAANPAVITLSVTHGYVVGQKVKIIVPTGFGMPEINGLVATITAINTATNTITTDINAAAFTAFAFPTSAVAAAGVTHPHIIPNGEITTILTGAVANEGYRGMYLGSGVVGANNSVMRWKAFKGIEI